MKQPMTADLVAIRHSGIHTTFAGSLGSLLLVLVVGGCGPQPDGKPAAAGTLPERGEHAPAEVRLDVDAATLRFDGLYGSTEGDATHYLRFYSDGTLVFAVSTGKPAEVAKWLAKRKADIAQGTWSRSGMTLRFVIVTVMSSDPNERVRDPDDFGAIEFEGTIKANSLDVGQRTYSFERVSFRS